MDPTRSDVLSVETKHSDGIDIIYVNGERIGVKIDDLLELDVVNDWTYPATDEVSVGGEGKMLYGRELAYGRELELVGYENGERRELIAVRTKCQCSADELRELVINILSKYEGKALMDYLNSRQAVKVPN